MTAPSDDYWIPNAKWAVVNLHAGFYACEVPIHGAKEEMAAYVSIIFGGTPGKRIVYRATRVCEKCSDTMRTMLMEMRAKGETNVP